MGAHTQDMPWRGTTNFDNSLRKKTNLSCFPLLGGRNACVHTCVHVHVTQSIRVSESRDSGVTRPHFQQSHVLTAGARGPVFAQTSRLWLRPHLPAPEPRNMSVTCDPPWEAPEQRRESESQVAGEPGTLELVHDPRGPQLPPVTLADRLPRGGGQTRRESLGTPPVPQACVSPPLQRQADSPSPAQLTSQTNKGMWPSSLSMDPP